ncbi:hypothetical protein BDZ85DRAFT_131409 [Elsinoe ampelina]|uniref:Concanavalin A-like lectin/glucanase domain-containing protein n=1 Tax=Elsinoe ampelina TaxID=302913 RepID=A0A6A6GAU9_9PEZI|nr:hypothetical protein BDZ85DRAFT_131409 [Elsinoe ampelina]
MKSTSSILLLTAASLALARGDYGWHFSNALSTGPTASGSFIREATTTLVLPATNKPQKGNLSLWAGMGTSENQLIQALAISVAGGTAGCVAATGQWCIVTSTLQDTQKMGTAVPASAGSKVTMHYKYNDSTRKYDQTVSLNGAVVSRLSTTSGKALGWGTSVECQSSACGTAPAHKYIDTKLIMDKADPNYIRTKGTTGATGTMVTADGGKTWTIAEIAIQAHTYT